MVWSWIGFHPGEWPPQRQDITQYLAAWSRHAGLSDEACRAWLKNPVLLKRDAHAEYKAVLEIDLGEITEPLVACPNDPDDVKPLSAVAGDPVQEVFIGSCMTNIGQFRAAASILDKAGVPPARVWITPPTKMDAAQLMREGYYAIFASQGGRNKENPWEILSFALKTTRMT